MHQLCREYGLTLVPHVGQAYSWFDGQLIPDSDLPRPPQLLLRELRRLAERFRRAGKGAAPLHEFLGTPECAELLSRSAVTQRYIEQLLKNDHSVEPTVLTLEAWLEPDVTGFEANFHIDEGYSALLHCASEGAAFSKKALRPLRQRRQHAGRARTKRTRRKGASIFASTGPLSVSNGSRAA